MTEKAIDLTLAAKEASLANSHASQTPTDDEIVEKVLKEYVRLYGEGKGEERGIVLWNIQKVIKLAIAETRKTDNAAVLALLDAKIEKVGAFVLAGISIKRALSELRAEIVGDSVPSQPPKEPEKRKAMENSKEDGMRKLKAIFEGLK